MSVIASLVVNLSANVANFGSNISKAEKHLKGLDSVVRAFTPSISGLQASLLGLGAAFGITLSARAAHEFVSGAMDAIDVTAKLSDRLDISTESLIGLQHAGDLAGADIEALTKGLDILNRTLGDAAAGSKTAIAAFQRLKLDPKKLQGQDLAKTFGQISDALNRLPTASQRASAAQDIFGRSAAQLASILAMGSEELENHEELTKKLGLSYSRFDAAQVERANDAIETTIKAFKGLGNAISIGVAPFLEAAANALTEFVKGGLGIDTVTKSILTLARAMGPLLDSLHQLRIFHSVFRDAENPAALRKLLDQMPSLQIDKAIANIEKRMQTNQAANTPQSQFYADLMRDYTRATNLEAQAMEQRMEAGKSHIQELAKFAKDLFTGIGDGLNNAIENTVAKLTEELKTPSERLEEQFKVLKGLHDIGRISDETFRRGLQKLQGQGDEIAPINAPIEAGTVEAFRAAHQRNNPLVKLGEDQLEEAKKLNALQNDIKREIRDAAPQNAEVVF